CDLDEQFVNPFSEIGFGCERSHRLVIGSASDKNGRREDRQYRFRSAKHHSPSAPSSPTGSPEVAACATRLSPGILQSRNAPRNPSVIRNCVMPNGTASSESDGTIKT